MKIWFDTEFIEDGKTIELLSIGMVREDGATYYAEIEGVDHSRACDWVQKNVISKLTGIETRREMVAKYIVEFAGEKPEFWAWYGAYDWVALCQLYGTMMDLPKDWPMFCRDLRQLIGDEQLILPPNHNAHNALDDALWTKEAFYHVWKWL